MKSLSEEDFMMWSIKILKMILKNGGLEKVERRQLKQAMKESREMA